MDLTLLPESLRRDVGQLVDGLTQAQNYVDLLVARLEHDQRLPEEKKLRSPLFWLRSVIADRNTDFCAAEEIALRREKHAASVRRNLEERARLSASKERKAGEIQLAQDLLDSLPEAELSQLADQAALEVPAVLGSRKRHEVRSLVMNRSVGTNLARAAVLKALQGYASRAKPL